MTNFVSPSRNIPIESPTTENDDTESDQLSTSPLLSIGSYFKRRISFYLSGSRAIRKKSSITNVKIDGKTRKTAGSRRFVLTPRKSSLFSGSKNRIKTPSEDNSVASAPASRKTSLLAVIPERKIKKLSITPLKTSNRFEIIDPDRISNQAPLVFEDNFDDTPGDENNPSESPSRKASVNSLSPPASYSGLRKQSHVNQPKIRKLSSSAKKDQKLSYPGIVFAFFLYYTPTSYVIMYSYVCTIW